MKRFKQWLRVRLAYLMGVLPFWPVPKKKFVIFGQGRTGSTLLVDLLNAAEDTFSDREIFNIFHFTGEKIKNPKVYVKGRSKRFTGKVYGFKVKIYQLKHDHNVASVREFLLDLVAQGYQIIYLSRDNVLQHAYSNVKRSLTGVTHIRGVKNARGKITLSLSELMGEIKARLAYKKEELEVLKGLDYHHVIYERDLLEQHLHLHTVNAVRKYLQLDPISEVKSKYQKITDKSLADEITNYDEVLYELKEQQLDSLVW
jgi:LPS sulfotransferase NodH